MRSAKDEGRTGGDGPSTFDLRPSALFVGTARLMEQANVDTAAAAGKQKELEGQGKTAVFVARDGRLLGLLAVADTVKPDSAAAVGQLRRLGLAVHLLTGDNERTARAIAAQVGIDAENVAWSVSPAGKVERIRALQQGGRKVAFVGDGINDAAALAAADLGLAIGTRADAALEAAGVTLVGGELTAAVRAIRLSRAALAKVKQNLFWAFLYNTLGIPLAMFYGGLDPMYAAAAMAASSVCVVTNSLLLNRVKL